MYVIKYNNKPIANSKPIYSNQLINCNIRHSLVTATNSSMVGPR